MTNIINIHGIDKAAILATLYNHSTVQGLGILQAKNGDMTTDEARKILDEGKIYFDYLYGRVMKINLDSDELKTALYDRDNGNGAAKFAISKITIQAIE